MKMKSQITVFLENQPGAMATVCRILKEQKANIQAFTVFGTVDHGVLRMIVDRPESVLAKLSKQGLLAIESQVIELPAENRPGVLHELASCLASMLSRKLVDFKLESGLWLLRRSEEMIVRKPF